MFECLLEVNLGKLRKGHRNISASRGHFQNHNGDILQVYNTGALDSIVRATLALLALDAKSSVEIIKPFD